MTQPAPPRQSQKPACPICGRPADRKTRPFCSARCADVDLGRWFGEGYRVPAAAADGPSPEEEDPA